MQLPRIRKNMRANITVTYELTVQQMVNALIAYVVNNGVHDENDTFVVGLDDIIKARLRKGTVMSAIRTALSLYGEIALKETHHANGLEMWARIHVNNTFPAEAE